MFNFNLEIFFIALIAFAISSYSAQEIDCREEFFRVSRRAENCQEFLVCMVGGRVNFFCDDGDIFDPEQISCRPGDVETCEYTENSNQSQWKHLSKFLD